MKSHESIGEPRPRFDEGVAWHVSTKSDNGGVSCVEAGPILDGSGRIVVRNSNDPSGPQVVFTAIEWKAFAEGVKDGEFDF